MRQGNTDVERAPSTQLRLCALIFTLGLMVPGAGQAWGAPAHHTSGASGLINQIAKANQNIADLDQAVSIKQENVNRALVDYQNAVAAERLATVAESSAKKSLHAAQNAVTKAQHTFDQFARNVYKQGSAQGSMSNYVSSSNPQSVLDRITVVDRVGKQQQDTIARLDYARKQLTNRVAAVEATRRQASMATKSAGSRKSDALAAFKSARQAAAGEQQRRSALVQKRDAVQAQLDKMRGVAPRHQADAQNPANLLQNLFPHSPGAPPATPADGNDQAAVAAKAASQLAVDVGQKVLAGVVGKQQIPHSQLLDALGIGGSDMTGSGPGSLSTALSNGSLGSLFGSGGGGGGSGSMVVPGIRGPQAVEIVVNRALSQLGVPYAWGGGDANGPTRGMRDGGTADQFGDYNKIGFDCSGLMVYAFAGVGVNLPHYTGYQYTSGPHFPLSQIQRGDMIFYGANASQHVALYIGDNKMVEAPESGSTVKVSPLRTSGAMPEVVRLL